jgi:hypothetical protein
MRVQVYVCQGILSRAGAVLSKQILGLSGGQSQNLKGRFRANWRKARFWRNLAQDARIKLKLYFRAARIKISGLPG